MLTRRKTNRAPVDFASYSGAYTLYMSFFLFLAIYLELALDSWASWRLRCTLRVLSWPGTEAGLARLLTCMNKTGISYILYQILSKQPLSLLTQIMRLRCTDPDL
jgi:hypothetical protein